MASNDVNVENEFKAMGLNGKKKYSVDEILLDLVHGSVDSKIQAAQEIRRLTKTSAKSRANLAAAGVIPPLVAMLNCNSTSEAKEASMLALLNLAVLNERNKMAIVKAGAIPSLVGILQSERNETRDSAAVVLLTLSAADANKPDIGNSGAIPLLVEMLTSASLQGKVDAVMALYNLSTYSDNLIPILAAGAVAPLIRLLKDCKKATKVAEKTTAILESLSAFEDGRSSITNEEGGILTLIEVLEEGSLPAKELVVSALLKMCESSRWKYRQAILKEGAIPGLLELTVEGSRIAREKAKTLLQLLRESPDSPPPRSVSAPNMLESIAYDIAAHVDNAQPGAETAKKMLTEMVQMSMEQSMRHLQQRAMISMSHFSN